MKNICLRRKEMKRKTLWVGLALLVLAVVSMATAACEKKKEADGGAARTFRLGHQAAAGTAYDILSNKFKEYVETRSNGRYTIEIHSGATLGNDRVLTESIIAGTVDFATLTGSDISNFSKELEVQDMPFLFANWDEVFNFLKSDFASEFYAITDSAGIATLAYMPRGFRHVTNNKGPITSPADFAGMKIRVVDSSLYVNTFKALGANPQAMAWGEVFTALQQGTVDGHENTIITINDYKINEVQKYVSKTGHIFAFAAIVMNPALLNSLPAADQDLIRQAAIDASLEIGMEQLESENSAAANLVSNGMIINEVPNKQPFVDKMAPVYENFLSSHDRKYFDGIKASVK
jgi:tripartite ATP-independent transporter DctP family solute receptor